MPGYVKIGVAFGGLPVLPLACDWEEFHAREGDECLATTGSVNGGRGVSFILRGVDSTGAMRTTTRQGP